MKRDYLVHFENKAKKEEALSILKSMTKHPENTFDIIDKEITKGKCTYTEAKEWLSKGYREYLEAALPGFVFVLVSIPRAVTFNPLLDYEDIIKDFFGNTLPIYGESPNLNKYVYLEKFKELADIVIKYIMRNRAKISCML